MSAAVLLVTLASGCHRDHSTAVETVPAETVNVSTPPPIDQPGALTVAERRDLGMSPQQFIDEAASGGLFEVQTAQLAIQRSPDRAQVDLANDMLRDHQRLYDELRDLAARKNLIIPDRLLPRERLMVDRLRDARDTDFGRLFQDQQLQAHDDTIALFEQAARDLTDPDLRAFADRALPTLREHRRHLMMNHGG